MIKIVAKMVVREDAIGQFHELARELVEKSRAEEGNISYSLNQSTADQKLHAFIDIWKDQAAIDAHNQTEHFTTILPKLAELTTEPQPVDLFTEVSW